MKVLKYKEDIINVYFYTETERLIKRIAEERKDDVTAISRGGKGRNKKYYYNFPCSFDIETSTILPGSFGYEHPDGRPLGVPYLFQWNIYGYVIMCRYIREAVQIFNWIAKYFCKDNKTLVLFDMNLAYEYGFFKDYWKLVYKECFAIDIHHPVTLICENGLMIRDSFKMTNMGLETLTEDWSKKWIKAKEIMDYKQIRMPWTELDDNTLIYSALDVLSLSDAMEEYLKARDTGPWTRNPTSTSFIRSKYKSRIGIGAKCRNDEQRAYFDLLEDCKIDAAIYAMMIRQARGGNTHAYRGITGLKIDLAGHKDITSSYPAQMVCYSEYPMGCWSPLDEGMSIDDIMLMEKSGYCCLFDLVLIDPEIKPGVTVPYLPISKCTTLKGFSRYSDNGRYITGAEILETTIYGIEWPIIAAQYDFKEAFVIRGYFARKGYLPDILRRFILELYAKKTELKKVEGKEIEYSLAKTYINGIFGMAFTKIVRTKCAFDEKGIFEGEQPDPEEELARFQKSSSYFLCYAWGAMTATLGRVYLQKMIDACGENFLYCDTDSVFYSDPDKIDPILNTLEEDIKAYQRKCGFELTYYDKKGEPHELGGIDDEGRCSFKTFGAKKYCTVTEKEGLVCTIAGVPKKEGSKLIKTLDDFKLDMVFPGSKTNKMCLWYNDDEGITIRDGRHSLRVKSNIAMLPVDYLLGLGYDYKLCLQIEGINPIYDFTQNDTNMNEEYI